MSRVAPPRVFPRAVGASRPPADPPGPADAYRQLSFVLGDEVAAVLEGLEAEAAIATASAGAKFRTQAMAASLGLWSRNWLARLQALHATQWGNYVAAIPLVRAAVDYQAAMLYVIRDRGHEWEAWLADGGIATAPAEHATEIRLHAFRAGEVLAANEVLGRIYRGATDLSLSHFGATILLAGSESSPDRIAMTFGDRDFHLGLAELVLGWLLELGTELGEALESDDSPFDREAATHTRAWRDRARQLAARRDRCRIEEVERNGERRYLVHNWRKAPGAAPRRLLL